MLSNQKILITGASGQIGRYLVMRLTGKTTLLATNRQDLDITNRKAVFSVVQNFQPSIIINAAAYTQVDNAELDSEQAFAVNVYGAKHLAQAAQFVGAVMLHISTDYVFDGAKNGTYNETDTPNPINVYGKTKLAGEQAVAKACEKFVIVRTSWIFSAYGNNFVKTILRLAKTQDEIKVVSDQIGCPTYAGDIVDVLIIMAGKLATGAIDYRLYHYCGTPCVSRYEFAQSILTQAKKGGLLHKMITLQPVLTSIYKATAKRPIRVCLDCDRTLQNLGLEPGSWRASLGNCLK